MSFSKTNRRQSIKYRIRNKISGTSARPRLAIFRSNKQIYAQIIDDSSAQTLCSVASTEPTIDTSKTKSEVATAVGKLLASKAIEAGITTVVFDRSGFLYHGRVKSLADGAREAGLKF